MKLAELVSETGLSRNELLNQAIVQYREKVVPVINEPENVTVEAIKFPPGKPKKVTPYRPAVEKPAMRVLTREEREAKIAAAQNWLPKGGKKR